MVFTGLGDGDITEACLSWGGSIYHSGLEGGGGVVFLNNGIAHWSDKLNQILFAIDNCLDRHAEQDPSRIALIWEKDEPGQHEQLTYRSAAHRHLCHRYPAPLS